jgi:subtilase family serine protease
VKQILARAVPLVAVIAGAACTSASTPNLPTSAASQRRIQSPVTFNYLGTRVCNDTRPFYASCDVLLQAGPSPAVSGWTPADFQARYNLPSQSNGAGQIVAIVAAFDNPHAVSDLAKYRTHFGLGAAQFYKFNQYGQQSGYPPGDRGWGLEEDLDIEMVSAVCPKCTIYLVEAASNAVADLETAEAEAVTLGAHIVSNSWGCHGSNYCVQRSAFDSPGVVYLGSAGDAGYGTQAPAALAEVVAVGGTVLTKTGSAYDEGVWPGTGSGCASGIAKPSWQHHRGCRYRIMNDVSAVASDVAEYDSYGRRGWFTVAGTSISTPLVAGVYALAGNAALQNAAERLWTVDRKKRAWWLHDVVVGSNGLCRHAYWCGARTGYDGPTGWGTPNGIKAF